jgi:hypothetical protein
MIRDATGEALRTCVSEEYPLEEAIWCTNADSVWVNVDWNQTIYDQDPSAPAYYRGYDDYANGRIWEHLRLTIDGQPHHGAHVDDPNDLLQSRFWQRDIAGPIDGYVPYWLSPITLGDFSEFGDDKFKYEWHVADDPVGQGIADILVKGRDIAGNILTYEEARLSDAYGKKVLIDVEAPEVDGDMVHLTAEEMEADEEAFDDNYLGEGYEDPVTGGYVFIEIRELDTDVVLAEDIWVNDDGSVDPSLVDLISGDTVNVCAIDLAGNETCEEVVVQPHVESCVYHLCPGFNMIAISVEPEDRADLVAGTLFPGMSVYTLDGGTYNPVDPTDTLGHNEGYLVMSDVETDIMVSGDPVETFIADGLLPGWNLIGGPWTSILTVDAGVYPPGAIDLDFVHHYACSTGSYVPTNTFDHCRGHLVMVTVDDTAAVVVPDTATGSKVVYTSSNRSTPELWNGMLEVESGKNVRSLTFGVANDATSGIDMNHDITLFPTLPGDDGVYLDNHLAKSVVANNNQVEWTLVVTDEATITPNVDNVPERWTVMLESTNLRDVSSLRLEAGTYKVTAQIAEMPTEFTLEQNNPNPFNPVTSINYSVPAESHVTIEIFNVLGERVTTLVDEVQEAGSRTVSWNGIAEDGSKATSGVYFYKMKAGDYSETKKMTLVK